MGFATIKLYRRYPFILMGKPSLSNDGGNWGGFAHETQWICNRGGASVCQRGHGANASGRAGRSTGGRADFRAGWKGASTGIGFRFDRFFGVGAEWANQCFAWKRRRN